MKTRIITGVILVAAVIAWLFFASYEVFAIGALFMYVVGAYEMGPLIGFKSRLSFVTLAVVAACIVFYFAVPGKFVTGEIPAWCYALTASGIALWVIALPLLYKFPKGCLWHKNRFLASVFSLWMLLPFLIGLLILRSSGYAQNPLQGAFLLAAVMALAILADTGAYFCGKALGKTPMIPRVSPHKTLEGLAGGLLLALLGMLVFIKLGWYAGYEAALIPMLVIGALTVLFSVVGDLVESMLKRLAGIKDSGRIFPGHGGMLDRIDSQLAVIPVFTGLNYLLSLAA
ncbi:MAG: phosphatidate cytidylyltransferase [Succinivibrio sp.]|jgi:phosphatidate cytidylyltransferase|nr:phosphatidate cytidylyltransferase [Succinivibrio sp.]